MKKKVIKIIVAIILLILLDQVIKLCVEMTNPNVELSFININYIKNVGGAFGIAYDNLVMVILSNFIVLGIIIKFMINQFEKIDSITKTMLCIVLAGGISNLLDRMLRGFVIDYISIRKFPSI